MKPIFLLLLLIGSLLAFVGAKHPSNASPSPDPIEFDVEVKQDETNR